MGDLREQEPGGPEYCSCPDCDYETEKRRGIPCRSMVCPECRASLVAAVEPGTEETSEETALDPLSEALRDGIAACEVALAVVNGSGELSGEDADQFLRSLRSELLERKGTVDWTAKAGGQIVGSLYRGAGGRFTGKGGEGSGLTMSDLQDYLKLFAAGKLDSAGIARLAQLGIVNEDGELTSVGKEVVTALRAGDTDKVNQLIRSTAKTVKAPGGKGGGAARKEEKPPAKAPSKAAPKKRGGRGQAKKEPAGAAADKKGKEKEDKEEPKARGRRGGAGPKRVSKEESVLGDNAMTDAVDALESAVEAGDISDDAREAALIILDFANGKAVDEEALEHAMDLLGFLKREDGEWGFTGSGSAFLKAARDGDAQGLIRVLSKIGEVALLEYGRRVNQAKIDRLQRTIDDFQVWITEIQQKLLAGEKVLLDFEAFLRWAQYDDAAMWMNRGGKAVPIRASAANFQEKEGANMPYSSMDEVNPAIKGIKPPVTLAQANIIAGWADAMEQAENGPDNPWAAAIAQFKRLYETRGNRWIKKEAAEELGEATDADRDAQKKRAAKYGIGITSKTNITKPKEYADLPESQFGDPVNFKWPADEEHAPSVAQYFNRSGMRQDGGYTPEDWAKIGRRLATLLTRHMPATYEYREGKLVHAERKKEAHMRIIEALRAGDVEQVVTALEASNKAMLAVGRVLAAIEAKDAERAKAELKALLDATGTEEGASLFGYPQQDEGFLVEVDADALRAQVKEAISKVNDGDWAAAKAIVSRIKGSFKGSAAEHAPLGESEGKTGEEEGEATEADLREDSGEGFVIGAMLNETAPPDATNPDRAPLKVVTRLIAPGWGNERDNNYYPAQVLARDAHVFEGASMYVTDHEAGSKSERTKVSVIEKSPLYIAPDGAIVALATIFDPDMAEKTRNRARAGQLGTLRCSIFAKGLVKPDFEQDGRKGKLVEAIKGEPMPDVDWVTRDGAGGHAVALMSEADVRELLAGTSLPQAAQDWLAEGEYKDETQLQEAVDVAAKRVKELSGSGQPVGEGGTHLGQPTGITPEEKDAAYRELRERYLPHDTVAVPTGGEGQ